MPATKARQFIRMMFAYFLCYLAMVMPLSSLSIHVTRDWGMSNFMAGLAAGSAFFATLLSRKWAGDHTDRMGGKHCCLEGVLWYAGGSAVCLLGALAPLPPTCQFAALILGRMGIGVGESVGNVGLTHWSVDVMGTQKTGRVIASIGMSMYAAVAAGGQTGYLLFDRAGFAALLAVCTLAPLAAFLLLRGCGENPRGETPAKKSSLPAVMRRIWRLSLPALFFAVGYAVLAAFLAKTFLDRGWPHAGWGLTCYGIGFVLMRVLCGHLPDRHGGLPVAACSAVSAILGLFLLWLAPGPASALAGAFFTGAGCSMIFPSLAMEIIRISPKEQRGASISGYNIFIDVSYGFAGPAAGFFTDRFGDSFAYLFAAVAAVLGMAMLANLLYRRLRGLKV